MDVRNNRRQDGRASVVTANRLRDGHVVWLTAAGATSWSETIDAAARFDSDGIEAAIERARAGERAQVVVDVYGVQIETPDGRPVPVTARERIRAAGPSVRPLVGLPDSDGDNHGS